jgi:sigma-B regulation protein RsbU (phosphoserine phosphatase)
MIIVVFFAGIWIGGGVGWYFWWCCRRAERQAQEEKQALAQERAIVIDFMHDMVEAIGEGLNRRELFQRVVHAAILSTGALSACIFERDEDKLRGVAVEGLFPPHRPLPAGIGGSAATRAKFIEQIMRSEVFSVGEGLVGTAAQSGQGILIADARQDPRVVRHDDPALAIRSVIVVPISFRARNLAVLAIVNPADGWAFSETDFSLAEALAEQAGLAIHNLDLMAMQIEKNKLDADISLAREIQGMLLPRQFPDAPELDISAVYQPAQTVGGDLYDVFAIDAGRIGVAIADVSGKGVAASLIMAICQANLRHFARMHAAPAQVLRELNNVMFEEMKPEMFVTVVYAVIDTGAQTITFARGGHELPLLLRAAGAAAPLPAAGMALGMVPQELFVACDEQVAFGPGDIFLLYTDGVTEMTSDDGIEFGAERLIATLDRLRGLPADAISEGIIDRLAMHAGELRGADDITMVVVRHR